MSQTEVKEIILKRKNALWFLIVFITLQIVVLVSAILFFVSDIPTYGYILMILLILSFVLYNGFKALSPNEALVLTLFGKYYGTLSDAGFFFVNPFCTTINPEKASFINAMMVDASGESRKGKSAPVMKMSSKISLKAITLNNDKQKVNDKDGNPIEIGVIVVWKIRDTAKAVFSVDNYRMFVSSQTDSSIRHVARLYPYDMSEDGDEKSLRGSSQEVADELKSEIQKRVELAGIEVIEARISHLAYAQEIAAAMLQRQQASAIIAARQKIVEGAVGMVQMALEKLSENNVVELDAERKAQMVSNLLVVLCGNKDAQPVVGTGSIF